MFCDKCGKEIEKNSSFCPHCGEKIAADVTGVGSPKVPFKTTDILKGVVGAVRSIGGGKRKPSKRGMVTAVAAVLVLLIAVFTGSYISNASERELAKQLDLGNRYLAETDYEQAVVAFARAIEIDPMSVDAYLGLIDAYIGMLDIEMAVETARKGYEVTGDESLYTIRYGLEGGTMSDSQGRTILRIGYDRNSDVAWIHVYTYDGEEVRIAAVTAYNAAREETGRIELVYDQEGHMTTGFWFIDEKIHERYGEMGLVKHTYQNGQRVKEEYFKDTAGNELFASCFFDSEGKEERKEYYSAEGGLEGYSEFEFDDDVDPPLIVNPYARRLIRETTFWNTGSSYTRFYDLDLYFRDDLEGSGRRANNIIGHSYNEEYLVSRTEYSIYRYDEEIVKEEYEKHGEGTVINDLLYFFKEEWFLSVEQKA